MPKRDLGNTSKFDHPLTKLKDSTYDKESLLLFASARMMMMADRDQRSSVLECLAMSIGYKQYNPSYPRI